MDYDSMVQDATIYKLLVDLYSAMAGYSSGYIETLMQNNNMTRAAAELKLMAIDKAARAKVDEAFKMYKEAKGDDSE